MLTKKEYEEKITKTREERMKWWSEAHFGMFIHYGLFSLYGRHEWARAIENCPAEEYELLINKFMPKENACEEWVKLAKRAGMKYIVLTTRHHEGFSLWNSKVNEFNSYNSPAKRDIVKEFVEACRKHNMKIGFYFSLMDWHNPDGRECVRDSEARLRFTKYIYDMVEELMTGYGKIDILWYDIPDPMLSHEGWNSLELNQMVRKHQPHIVINNRSRLDEDFGTPEGKISPDENKYWESCMTFNDISWGYIDSEQVKPYSYNAHRIIRMLARATVFGGNLLLNIGPKADGSVPEEAIKPLEKAGEWLNQYGDEILYGRCSRVSTWNFMGCFSTTRKQNNVYLWNWIWPDSGKISVGSFKTKLLSAEVVNGDKIEFTQENERIILMGLPEKSPDKILGITPIKLIFEEEPEFPDTYRFASIFPQINIDD